MSRFLPSFASGLLGVLLGCLIMATLPAAAGEGDPMTLGEKNLSKTVTRLTTRGGLRIDNVRTGNPALILNVQPGTAPLQTNSSVLVDGFNSDLLDGFEANDLVRATYDREIDVADANGAVLATSITTTVPGILLVSGVVDAYGTIEDLYHCHISVDGFKVDGSDMYALVADAEVPHTPNREENCSTTAGIAVAPGIHAVNFVIEGRDTVTFANGSMWVLFEPFDGVGVLPSP